MRKNHLLKLGAGSIWLIFSLGMKKQGGERKAREREVVLKVRSVGEVQHREGVFFQVELIGCCKWQKGRLEMASPTLADSLN